jgi:hypothetical protein
MISFTLFPLGSLRAVIMPCCICPNHIGLLPQILSSLMKEFESDDDEIILVQVL